MIVAAAERVRAAGRDRGRLEQRHPRQRPGRHAPTASSARSAQVAGHSAQVTLLTDREPRRLGGRLRARGDRPRQPRRRARHADARPRPEVAGADARATRSSRRAGKVGRLTSIYPYGHPDRHRQRRVEQRGRPLLERPGRAVRPLRLAALGDRAGPEEAEPAVSPTCSSRAKVAVLSSSPRSCR